MVKTQYELKKEMATERIKYVLRIWWDLNDTMVSGYVGLRQIFLLRLLYVIHQKIIS